MWWRGDDGFDENPKVRRVRRTHPEKRRDAAAVGLWFQACTWSARNKTDGFVPEEILETFDDHWEKIIARLVEVTGPSGHGMLEGPETVNGELGYWVHDFLDFNDSREEQERDAHANRMRVELQRDVALVTAIKRRDKDRCRYCGCQVNWRARRGKSAATYDHVHPIAEGGKNTLDNVVVACKGCNDRKGKRSLRAAGMKLLEPGVLGAPALDNDPDDDQRPHLTPVRTEYGTGSRAGAEGSSSGPGRVGSGAQNVSSTRAGVR
jgi:hypothetical protein